ncbi:MAG: gamma-glutamylcyclotransferase, partial [Rhodospirillales bacterium]|nr:gamma-glutamylcyclotransferase [Rhodospirillales bacterium]
MRFFFYGTLIDPDVRRAVLGRLAPASVEPATLKGWRRFSAKGVTFPIARP